MSRRCDLTGKTAQVGHKVSHSNRKTKRRFLPNLLNVTMISDALGRSVKLRMSANALKTVDHRGGLDAFLLKAKDDELSTRALELKRQIRKKKQASGAASETSRQRLGWSTPGYSDQGSASVNCSSSVRWMSEKLSSEISVSTSVAVGARCTHRPSMLSI